MRGGCRSLHLPRHTHSRATVRRHTSPIAPVVFLLSAFCFLLSEFVSDFVLSAFSFLFSAFCFLLFLLYGDGDAVAVAGGVAGDKLMPAARQRPE